MRILHSLSGSTGWRCCKHCFDGSPTSELIILFKGYLYWLEPQLFPTVLCVANASETSRRWNPNYRFCLCLQRKLQSRVTFLQQCWNYINRQYYKCIKQNDLWPLTIDHGTMVIIGLNLSYLCHTILPVLLPVNVVKIHLLLTRRTLDLHSSVLLPIHMFNS